MTDTGEKLRDRVALWYMSRQEHFDDPSDEYFSETAVAEFASAELERAAGIADRFKQPWIGEEIRKLKE